MELAENKISKFELNKAKESLNSFTQSQIIFLKIFVSVTFLNYLKTCKNIQNNYMYIVIIDIDFHPDIIHNSYEGISERHPMAILFILGTNILPRNAKNKCNHLFYLNLSPTQVERCFLTKEPIHS